MQPILDNIELFLFISALAVTTFGFIAYLYIVSPRFTLRILKLEMGKPLQAYVQRLVGAFIYGILPVIIILISGKESFGEFGIKAPTGATYLYTLALSVLILPMNYLNAPKPANLNVYPQIREGRWSLGLILGSAISWIIYLTGYEFLFRGFLFYTSLNIIGLWPAIILNTAIYSLVHLPKGFKEMAGAIPLGMVLCYLTYLTGSIWVAVFTHIILALSNEWFSLYKHPEMIIKRVRK